MSPTPPRVFISYAHEPDAAASAGARLDVAGWVLALAKRLRDDGVDAWIDRYEPFPAQGWRPWMTEQIERADWMLVVCTEEYLKRFEGNAPAEVGRGVRWESQHITQQLYDHKFSNSRFVPVLPPGGEERFIPLPLKDYRNFRLDDGYEALYRLLTGQHDTPAPALGPLRRLAPLPVPALGGGGPGAGAASATPAPLRNPYPGLAAFREEDRDDFFGRQADTERVLQKLATNRLVSVVGPSGTGKSSLVAAGVVPALRAKAAGVACVRFKPQADPLRQWAEALDRALPEERVSLNAPRGQRILNALASDPVRAAAEHLAGLGPNVLVFADQFEELFTQTPPQGAERFRAVFDALLERDGLHLVLTLRSEFMHRLMEWLGGERFARSLVPLDPMTQAESLRAIVERPAARAGVPVQPEVVSTLLAAVGVMYGALPLVAMTLRRLFNARDAREGLTLDAYRRIGGLEGVVQTAAAEVEHLVAGQEPYERACERLFGELATVIDDVPTRRAAEVAPLRADAHVGALVEALRAQGFLVDPDERHVELAHETLLSRWPRLADWCERCSNDLALRRQAEQAARDWHRGGRREVQRWTWELQEPALVALLALRHQSPLVDAGFVDPGIHAWRALDEGDGAQKIAEPLRSFLQPEPLRLLAELETDATSHQRREEVGLRLAQMGDPRRGVGLDDTGLPQFEWVDVPAKQVTLEIDERPRADAKTKGRHKRQRGAQATLEVKPFKLARYPVTWAQYGAFLAAEDGYRNPAWWQGRPREAQAGERRWAFPNHPAINVSWLDAMAYCGWLRARLGLDDIRLPTEREWQWAAAGPSEQEYPWQGEWNGARANTSAAGIGRTIAVGMYPKGRSPFGIDDMAGNVWAWCLNRHDDPANVSLEEHVSRVLRGGSWNLGPLYARAAHRDHFHPDYRHHDLGFRVCRGSTIE